MPPFAWCRSSLRGWVALSLIALSCVPAGDAQAPEVSPSSTLAVPDPAAANPAAFALVHAAPRGPTSGDPSIHLVFSQPLRELGVDTPPPRDLSLQPAVPGNWQWVGVYGLTFVPDAGQLPRATQFTVEIPRSITSLHGEQLSEPSQLSFSTPLPEVQRAQPSRSETSATPGTPILLTFSQPPDAQSVAKYLAVTAGGEQLPISVTNAREPHKLVVTAKDGWPLASRIEAELKPGWVGTEGPLAAEASFTHSFETYGPLVAKLNCDRTNAGPCRPESGLRLELSNPVSANALSRQVRATGTTLHVDRDWHENATTRFLSLGAELKPGQKFAVQVGPIRDIYGQKLTEVRHAQGTVADYQPNVRIGFSGDSLLPSQDTVAVTSMNTGYELVTAALSPAELAGLDSANGVQRFEQLASLPGAQRRQVERGTQNQRQLEKVDLTEITSRGPFAIGIRYGDSEERHVDVRWGQRTDLAVSAKAGRDRGHVWVTRLSSGAPVSGATVRALGTDDQVATDKHGLATLSPGQFAAKPDKNGPARWLEVRSGAEIALRSSDDTLSPWRLPVSTDFHGSQEDEALLFPERDLFRPGERAWLKGYVRRPVTAGNEVLSGSVFTLTLESPNGEVVHSEQVTTNAFGAFSTRLTLPASGQLGYWTVSLLRKKQALTSAHLQLAEYRPADFEVDVSTEVPDVIAGEPVRWEVRGNYFHGGLMSDAPVETTARREPTRYSPPGLDDHVTDDDEWQRYEDYRHYDPMLSRDSTKLDQQGKLEAVVESKLKKQQGPERIELEATVTDLTAQTQSARTSVLVHPADHYVALRRLESSLIDAPGEVRPEVLLVSPEGKPLTGRSVTLSLSRVRWTHAKQQGSNEDATATVSEPVRDPMGTCTVVSGTQARSCPLRVPLSGHYIVRAVAKDAQGRSSFSSLSFYGVGGGGQSAWRDEDERGVVTLERDRELYQPGQSAKILVQSPFAKARAWVTVEKDGVLEQRVVALEGPSPTIEMPITKKMRPNAYVSVHLLEDRKALGKRAHDIEDSYRFGTTELRVDTERQRLGVAVRTRKNDYQPREEVELDFEVTDSSGKGRAAEVAVFVVDEGVLSLSGYQLPDPLEAFTRPRPLRVETIESRQNMARLFGLDPNQKENKGDPGGGGDGDRSAFVTAAYFNPSVVTDEAGKARVQFRLPDNLGRFRVMAVAVTRDDRYGRGQSSLTVNKKLMVRPALPRFLRAGDRFRASAVVSGSSFVGGPVEVSLSAEGLELEGATSRTITLQKGGSALVHFGARAGRVGQAKLRFVARGKGQEDSVVVAREVHSPAQLEAVALYGKTESADAHRLGQLDQVRKDRGKLDVTLSSSALVGLEGGFEQLWDYPYLCSEQLSSRALPLLLLRDFASLYGVEPPKDAEQRINSSVSQLVRRSRGDGGFGMWPESPDAHPWVSAYALWVLWEANQRGHDVSDSVFEKGARYLNEVASRREDEELTSAAFAALVLGKIQQPDANLVNALFDHVGQMSTEAQTVLLWAAAEAKVPLVVEPLLRRVEGAITMRGNAAEITQPHAGPEDGFYSDTRRHALALNALLAAKPQHAMAPLLVRTLLDARKGKGWNSTQDAAFALLSLDAYRRAQEKVEPEFEALVFLKDKLLGKKSFSGRSVVAQQFSVAMAELAAGGDLIVQRKGRGTLFYEARLSFARTELPTTPLESGFMVQKRTIPVVDGHAVSQKAVDTSTETWDRGTLVLVELTVLAPARRRFVAIESPLAAGLEAVDLSLDTAQGSLRQALDSDQDGLSHAWHRRELRDDRVLVFVDDMPPGIYRYSYLARATTAGTFVTPPARAFEMYQPEVYGRTSASKVVVQ